MHLQIYLQQHKKNPVNWQVWSKEAFGIAKEKHRASVEYLLRNNLRAYRQVTDIAEVRESQLNKGQ